MSEASMTGQGGMEGVRIFTFNATEQKAIWTSVTDSQVQDAQASTKLETSPFESATWKDLLQDVCCTSSPIKVEPAEDANVFSASSSATEYGDSSPASILDSLSTSSASPSRTVTFVSFCEQMEAEAARESTATVTSSPLLSLASMRLEDESYNSESSVTLAAEDSPCPRRGSTAVSRHTGKRSSYFKRNDRGRPRKATTRCPSWLRTKANRSRSRSPSPPKKSENERSLKRLRNIERSPMHRWTSTQREFLCVMNRWYERNPTDFAIIFNSIYGLNLSTRKVKDQFENYLRLYGGEAFVEFRKVFHSTPFNDPEDSYAGIRSVIESEADAMGLVLRPLQNEEVVASGMAAKARAISTRQIFKSLKRRASHRGSEPTDQILGTRPKTSLGGHAFTETQALDDIDIFVDVDDANVSSFVSPSSSSSSVDANNLLQPAAAHAHLAFRVWDDESRTIYTEDFGFVADLFAHRHGPVTRPLPRNDVYGLFDVLSNTHLSKKGNASAFVSVASSLLQVFNYSSKMKNPRIAIIDLDHPDLQEDHKMHRARQVIEHLQSKGEMWWTKYKAHSEYLVWGNLPTSAILHELDLADLKQLADHDPHVANLLSLDIFTGQSRTRTIFNQLSQKDLQLDVQTARAMGKMAQLFGLCGVNVTCGHVQDFTSSVVDGWAIKDAPVNNAMAMADLARRFALSMRTETMSISIQEVMGAFVAGVTRGTQNLSTNSPRRRTLQHSKIT